MNSPVSNSWDSIVRRVGREALGLLVERKLAPSPSNYWRVFQEVCRRRGVPSDVESRLEAERAVTMRASSGAAHRAEGQPARPAPEADDALTDCLDILLSALRPVVRDDEESSGHLDRLVQAVHGGVDPARLRDDLRTFVGRVRSALQGVRDLQEHLRTVLASVLRGMRALTRGRDRLHARITRFEQQVTRAETVHDLLRLRDALLVEARGVGEEIGRLQTEIDSAGESLASAQERLAAIEQELRRSREELLLDPLTGLLNRRGLTYRLEWEVQVGGGKEVPLAVVVADIDRFKAINDSLGHLAGDRVLVEVAGRLRRGARATDIVARFGGEEFVIVLPEEGLDAALRVAERMRMEVGRVPVTVKDRGIPVTASFGVACRRGGESFEDTLERADHALYLAKRGGRNRTCSENDLHGPAVKC